MNSERVLVDIDMQFYTFMNQTYAFEFKAVIAKRDLGIAGALYFI